MALFKKPGIFAQRFATYWESAQEIAESLGNPTVLPIHLLAAVAEESNAAHFLGEIGIRPSAVNEFITLNVPAIQLQKAPMISESSKLVFLESIKIASRTESLDLDSVCLLLGIANNADELVSSFFQDDAKTPIADLNFYLTQWIDGNRDLDSIQSKLHRVNRAFTVRSDTDSAFEKFMNDVIKFGALKDKNLLTVEEFQNIKSGLVSTLLLSLGE